MSEELKRTREALGTAVACLQRLSTLGGTSSVGNEMAREGLAKVEFLLNPPPEVEDVEECAGWVNIYPMQRGVPAYTTGIYASQELADKNSFNHRIDCQELRVKVKRPVRRAVIREYEVAAKVTKGCPPYGNGSCLRVGGGVLFADHPECHGKAGVLIFRTAE